MVKPIDKNMVDVLILFKCNDCLKLNLLNLNMSIKIKNVAIIQNGREYTDAFVDKSKITS